ncbi:MAG: zinc protease [Blastocatellia bacterium]|jgi:predicted Zn-dependent peptidase|nr:zinc protease [Blastocatellia bacterium]
MKIFKAHYTKLLTASLMLALVAANALAQGGGQTGPGTPTTKGAVIKGRAPVNKEVLKVKLPRAEETTLPNGLRVVVLQDHKVPTFTMQMVVLSGGLSDPSNNRGLAATTAALLREGTQKRTSKEIAEQTEALGATLNTGAGLSSLTSTVSANGLVQNLDQTLDIFADIVRNPKFAADEVEKYKTRTLAQLQFQRSSPQFLAQERFFRAIYGEHPAAFVAPPAEALKGTTVADLARFHQTYYRPNNSILAIVGDVSLKELLPKIQGAFGDWQKSDVPQTSIPTAPAQGAAHIFLIDRPGSVQTVLQLGTLGIERNDPDYFSLLVADKIFGGGPAARLFLNLREDKGYTYGAYSNMSTSKYRGVMMASSEVRTDVTAGAMKEFMYELKRLRDEPVTATELDNAKRAIIGGFALSLEQPQALLQNIITQKIYDLPADYWDTYPQRVAAITAEDVQRVAQKYVDLSHLQIVAVGDASKARDVLSKYGSVEVYDAEGKPVQ